MKHSGDFDEDGLDKLLEKVSEPLADLMSKIIEENDLCPMCAHRLIIAMCEAYTAKIEQEEDNAVKH